MYYIMMEKGKKSHGGVVKKRMGREGGGPRWGWKKDTQRFLAALRSGSVLVKKRI